MTEKYFRAFKPNGEQKPGVNKIVFNSAGAEETREYVPEGLPASFTWATLKEIDKHGPVYPFITDRNLLVQ